VHLVRCEECRIRPDLLGILLCWVVCMQTYASFPRGATSALSLMKHLALLSLGCKSSTAVNVRKWVVWAEVQTGHRVQRIRHDRGGEYINRSLQEFYSERGIEMEPTAGYTPEANGIAERHNLRLLDMILPMLADSAEPAYGLPPLSNHYAAEAAIYANDLHNAMPARAALVGRTPPEGFLGRGVSLGGFHRFGCRVWVHRPGHRTKLLSRGVPGRFLGFERPFLGNIYRVLLDDGRVTQSQMVIFSDVPGIVPQPHPPQIQGDVAGWEKAAELSDDASDDSASRALSTVAQQVTTAADGPQAAREVEEQAAGQVVEQPAEEVIEQLAEQRIGQAAEGVAEQAAEQAAEPIQHFAPSAHWQTQRAGQRPTRTSRNPNPSYTVPQRAQQPQANVAMAAAQDGASWDKLGEQIGEQTGEQIRKPLGEHIEKPQGEQIQEEGVRRRRRPGSRRVQRWCAGRRRRQQRKLQCASLASQACFAGVAEAADEAGAAH
jgi:hypothetical protein